jgi:hypothetical protein
MSTRRVRWRELVTQMLRGQTAGPGRVGPLPNYKWGAVQQLASGLGRVSPSPNYKWGDAAVFLFNSEI